jgi:hypothetical protein
MKRLSYAVPAVLILLASCAGPVQPTAVPASNLQATIDAAVKATQAAQPTNTPAATNTVQPTNTLPPPTNTPSPTYTPYSTATPVPTETPQPTVTSAPTSAAMPTVQATATMITPTSQAATTDMNSGITPLIQKVGYARWGRPKAMDDSKYTSCGETDNARPLYNMQISLAWINNTNQVWKTGTRQVDFYKTDGQPAFTCYYNFLGDKSYPDTNPGESYQFTYNVYVELNERVGYATISIEGVGTARVDMPANVPMP